MAKYSIDGSTLTDIADAIRTQYGEDTPIAVSDMAEAILGIEGGGGGLEVSADSFSFSKTTTMDKTRPSPTFYHSLGKIPKGFVILPADMAQALNKDADNPAQTYQIRFIVYLMDIINDLIEDKTYFAPRMFAGRHGWTPSSAYVDILESSNSWLLSSIEMTDEYIQFTMNTDVTQAHSFPAGIEYILYAFG